MPLSQNVKVELHAFGDASEVAYASAVYLRVVHEDGKVSTSLVMSKTRVAPVRKITLPRLELMAAVITARLCSYVKGAIDCPINLIVCWTDNNSSTLHWIRGAASQWKPFVANIIALLKFSHCWIPVFGGIVRDRRIQLIYLLEVYLQVS